MKRVIILLLLPTFCNAQKYCEVTSKSKVFSDKFEIRIDYGDSMSSQKFNNLPTALNYLAKNGWKLITATPTLLFGEDGASITKLYLRKEE